MPLAYLADPWQKMKVHEESEVILPTDKLKFEFFQFRFYIQGSELKRANCNIFTLLGRG